MFLLIVHLPLLAGSVDYICLCRAYTSLEGTTALHSHNDHHYAHHHSRSILPRQLPGRSASLHQGNAGIEFCLPMWGLFCTAALTGFFHLLEARFWRFQRYRIHSEGLSLDTPISGDCNPVFEPVLNFMFKPAHRPFAELDGRGEGALIHFFIYG